MIAPENLAMVAGVSEAVLLRHSLFEERIIELPCTQYSQNLNRFKSNYYRPTKPFDPSKKCYDNRREDCVRYMEVFQSNAKTVADRLYFYFHPTAKQGASEWGTKAKREWEDAIIKSGGPYRDRYFRVRCSKASYH